MNILGAFLVGYFVTRLQERLPLSSYRRPLLGTGLCGGLTTFSTLQVEEECVSAEAGAEDIDIVRRRERHKPGH